MLPCLQFHCQQVTSSHSARCRTKVSGKNQCTSRKNGKHCFGKCKKNRSIILHFIPLRVRSEPLCLYWSNKETQVYVLYDNLRLLKKCLHKTTRVTKHEQACTLNWTGKFTNFSMTHLLQAYSNVHTPRSRNGKLKEFVMLHWNFTCWLTNQHLQLAVCLLAKKSTLNLWETRPPAQTPISVNPVRKEPQKKDDVPQAMQLFHPLKLWQNKNCSLI